MKKTIILNRNGQGEVRSEWYATYYKSESEARQALIDRQEIAEKNNNGWDTELVLISDVEYKNYIRD